jgi:5-methylcytosine-specific restriction endonuclease McrA
MYGIRVMSNKEGKTLKSFDTLLELFCEACGANVDQKDVQGDHDIPRSWGVEAGGVTEKSNLRVLCATCNNKKSNKHTFDEFVKTLTEIA